MAEVPHHPVTVDMNDVQAGISQLITKVRPQWKPEQITYKTFTEGITNKLVGAHIGDLNEMVLTRVYGEKTDLFIDRDVEKKTMAFLHSHGCARPLFATFNNGLCYGFVKGIVFDDVMTKDRKYAALIAHEMARYHTLSVPADYAPNQTTSSYFNQFRTLLKLLPDKFSDPDKDKRYQTEVMSRSELAAAADQLEKIAQSWNEKLVLCHHDLLIKNLVYCEEENRVYFIDYEYAGMSYAAVDIADHFDEYAGIDEIDFSLYPAKDHQLFFLREYLEARGRYEAGDQAKPVTDSQLETWYKNVNKMALMPHLFWGVWGLLQAYHSSIDFDFLSYGIMKLNEYKRRKDEFLSL